MRSHTMTALVYMEDLIYQGLLTTMKQQLQRYEIDGILDSGMIEQLSEKHWLSPFPQFQTTERPDRACLLYTSHVVQPEETLWDIAKNHGCACESVRKLNELKDDNLKAGSKLLLVKELSLIHI